MHCNNPIDETINLDFSSSTLSIKNDNCKLLVNESVEKLSVLVDEGYSYLCKKGLTELEPLVTSKLETVSSDCIGPPNPGILLPVLWNASITEEKDVRELYANLLASSMNSVVKDGVHPSFVEIVKQLSSDEAKILNYMSSHYAIPTISFRLPVEGGYAMVLEDFTDIPERIACETADESRYCFTNLVRLGLVEKVNNSIGISDKDYADLEKHPSVKKASEEAGNILSEITKFRQIDIRRESFRLTVFGIKFCRICVAGTETE